MFTVNVTNRLCDLLDNITESDGFSAIFFTVLQLKVAIILNDTSFVLLIVLNVNKQRLL